VTRVLENGVEAGGERIESCNVIWAAGVRAAPLMQDLDVEHGPGGRVKVRPDCSLPGHANVFAIGDAAYLIDSNTGRPVPGVSQGALQMGRYVARVIMEDIKGRPHPNPPPLHGGGQGGGILRKRGFHYRDWGSMATVGKSRAVVEIGRVRFGGLLAWIAWMMLHITVLIGFRNRLAVLTSWIYSYVFFRRGSRLITRSSPLRN
jgi:NADH dehydrogenase